MKVEHNLRHLMQKISNQNVPEQTKLLDSNITNHLMGSLKNYEPFKKLLQRNLCAIPHKN